MTPPDSMVKFGRFETQRQSPDGRVLPGHQVIHEADDAL